jgi:hypothetical protein
MYGCSFVMAFGRTMNRSITAGTIVSMISAEASSRANAMPGRTQLRCRTPTPNRRAQNSAMISSTDFAGSTTCTSV